MLAEMARIEARAVVVDFARREADDDRHLLA
jgi:hypothetical protein